MITGEPGRSILARALKKHGVPMGPKQLRNLLAGVRAAARSALGEEPPRHTAVQRRRISRQMLQVLAAAAEVGVIAYQTLRNWSKQSASALCTTVGRLERYRFVAVTRKGLRTTSVRILPAGQKPVDR